MNIILGVGFVFLELLFLGLSINYFLFWISHLL